MFYLTRLMVLTLSCSLIGVTCGCSDTPEDAEEAGAPASRPVSDDPGAEDDQMVADDQEEAATPQIEYDGPKFDFSIEVMESLPEQYALSWNVTANTGGWVLTTDEVKHEGTSVQVYLTLVQPGPDEIVTMALETHRGKHDAGTAEIARAELYVRLITRGDDEDPPYLRAAIAP